MVLDDIISEITLENEGEAISVVLANFKVHLDFYDSFPKESVLLGNNWYFLADTKYTIQKPPCGSILPSDLSARIISKSQFRRNLPIPQVLEKIKKYAKGKEIALLLFSEARVGEAHSLWPDKDNRTCWYVVNEDDKKISVFPYARSTYEMNPVEVSFRATNK